MSQGERSAGGGVGVRCGCGRSCPKLAVTVMLLGEQRVPACERHAEEYRCLARGQMALAEWLSAEARS